MEPDLQEMEQAREMLTEVMSHARATGREELLAAAEASHQEHFTPAEVRTESLSQEDLAALDQIDRGRSSL